MRRVPVSVFSIVASFCLLSGCALTPDAPVDAQPAVPALAVPALSEADMPAPRSAPLVLPTSKPAMHMTAATARPAVLNARRQETQPAALPVKFVEQALAAGIGTSTPGTALRAAPAGKDVAKAQARAGPVWLKACQHRQQQADVIMCDADSLLTPPSDKVMVYVREAKLAGKQADGQRIALRESLPRLYRIFVLD